MANRETSRFGLATPEQAASLSGREFLQAIIDGRLPQPPIARPLSFHIVEVGEGFAVFEGQPGEELCNPMGIVHGGWALTLLDSAAGCAGHSLLPAGVGYTTIETKGNFSRPLTRHSGPVRAEGRVITHGRRIISAEAKVLGPDGSLHAHGLSTLMILGGSA